MCKKKQMTKVVVPATLLEDYSGVIEVTLTDVRIAGDNWEFNWSRRTSAGADVETDYQLDVTDDLIFETEDYIERELFDDLTKMLDERDNEIIRLKKQLADLQQQQSGLNKFKKWLGV